MMSYKKRKYAWFLCMSFSLSLLLLGLSKHALAKKEIFFQVDGKSAVEKLFRKAQSCSPELEWKEFRKSETNLTYDVAVHYALEGSGDVPPGLGKQVYYRENVTQRKVKLTPALQARTKYFWSVRLRDPVTNKVSKWYTHAPLSNQIIPIYLYSNMWFGLKTPQCD